MAFLSLRPVEAAVATVATLVAKMMTEAEPAKAAEEEVEVMVAEEVGAMMMMMEQMTVVEEVVVMAGRIPEESRQAKKQAVARPDTEVFVEDPGINRKLDTHHRS